MRGLRGARARPREKAFGSHDQIVSRILRAWHGLSGNPDWPAQAREPAEMRSVVAIVAGPAATVLTGELPCVGLPSIDVGHMNPYEDMGSEMPTDICDPQKKLRVYGPPDSWRDPLQR